ncbi:antibiotic biosynthesis monooxygenase [Aminobacter sp. LjRoot7]
MTEALEIVTFRLKPGKTAGFAAAFAAANEPVSDWLRRQPGFLSRHLAERGNSWIDVVRWQSREDAQAAAEKIMAEIGDCAAFQAIDPESIDMSHALVIASA